MLIVKNLEKNFGKTKVLKNINLEINEKERVVIIGPSGCGKSTLLRCINQIENLTLYDVNKIFLFFFIKI